MARAARSRRPRLLIVEDEPKVAAALGLGLVGEGFDVVIEDKGGDTLLRLARDSFDAILLDLTLPDRDGLDILREVRARGTTPPVLVLTASDSVAERLRGFECGADDYQVKPFAFDEVVARLRVLVRRRRGVVPRRLRVADLTFDPFTRRVTRAGRGIELTRREFEVLAYLCGHEGQIVSRDALARAVWATTARDTAIDNSIDVYICKLRARIDRDHSVKLIHTIRGVGFVLREGVR